jgi:hypothetical protein
MVSTLESSVQQKVFDFPPSISFIGPWYVRFPYINQLATLMITALKNTTGVQLKLDGVMGIKEGKNKNSEMKLE